MVLENTAPVFLSGMWPSISGSSESGTRVALFEKEGGSILIEGFLDPSGDFLGPLPSTWVGKQVHVAAREQGSNMMTSTR